MFYHHFFLGWFVLNCQERLLQSFRTFQILFLVLVAFVLYVFLIMNTIKRR